MMCTSFGLKISASSMTSLSERAAISVACPTAAADVCSPMLLPLLLPFPPEPREVTACSRQPITSPKSSHETESRTCATAARLSLPSPELLDRSRQGSGRGNA